MCAECVLRVRESELVLRQAAPAAGLCRSQRRCVLCAMWATGYRAVASVYACGACAECYNAETRRGRQSGPQNGWTGGRQLSVSEEGGVRRAQYNHRAAHSRLLRDEQCHHRDQSGVLALSRCCALATFCRPPQSTHNAGHSCAPDRALLLVRASSDSHVVANPLRSRERRLRTRSAGRACLACLAQMRKEGPHMFSTHQPGHPCMAGMARPRPA